MIKILYKTNGGVPVLVNVFPHLSGPELESTYTSECLINCMGATIRDTFFKVFYHTNSASKFLRYA